MPQFMGRKLGGIQSGLQQSLFYQPMYRFHADPVAVPGAEQSPVVRQNLLISFCQIDINGLSAGGTEVHKPLFVALANHTYPILINVGNV